MEKFKYCLKIRKVIFYIKNLGKIRVSSVSGFQPSAVSCPRSIVCCQLLVVCRLLFVVRCSLSPHLPSPISHLPSPRLPVSPSSVLCPLSIAHQANTYQRGQFLSGKSPGSSQAEGLKHPSPGQRPGINDGHPVRQAAGLQQTGCDSIHIHVVISISTQIIIRGIFDYTISFRHTFHLSPGDFICYFFVNIFGIQ
jgi:hypothetical protein